MLLKVYQSQRQPSTIFNKKGYADYFKQLFTFSDSAFSCRRRRSSYIISNWDFSSSLFSHSSQYERTQFGYSGLGYAVLSHKAGNRAPLLNVCMNIFSSGFVWYSSHALFFYSDSIIYQTTDNTVSYIKGLVFFFWPLSWYHSNQSFHQHSCPVHCLATPAVYSPQNLL